MEEAPKYARVRKAPQGSRYPVVLGDSNTELILALEALTERVKVLEQYKRDRINN